jgi:isopentenyl diphosphate isomerase/L-lactate dehydrogenase-like FMN-dependent dehydrogenase
MRNLSIQLFGKTYPTPVMFAPIGFQTVFHSEAEAGVAAIANEISVPFIMSMNSASSVEDIAIANKDGERWFQFYWPASDYRTITVLNRAKAAGFHVLVVTLDAFTLGWRPWDLDQAYFPTNRPSFNRPQNSTKPQTPAFPNITLTPDAFFSAPPSWERLKFLREHWAGPIVLKGIQHVDDAKLAATAGMDGIIVSNHGGRQLDGGVGSLEVLPEIVDAVGDKLAVLFDSGIRTGSDIIKALSLGAKAVLIGRPWAYGLGVAGKAGAKQVMQGILAELEINMNIAGLKSISDCSRSNLRRSNYAGDRHSSE